MRTFETPLDEAASITAGHNAGWAWTCRWLSRCVGAMPTSTIRSSCAAHSRVTSEESITTETGAGDQYGQGIEYPRFPSRQRRRRGERLARREIEVKAEREGGAGSGPRRGVVETRQVHYHRSGRDDARLCRLDYSSIYAARESVIVGVDDEPSGTTRRSHAHHFGGRGSGPSASRLHAWRRRPCSARRCSDSRPEPARS